MKMIQNAANVLGLTLGGLFLSVLGYTGFFVVFGLFLLGLAVMTFKNKSMLADVR
jgi:glucose dehydrogenase